MLVRRIKNWFKQKAAAVVLFSYGLIIGTSAPILLSRCASTGTSCSNCAGFCGVALGILPLVLFVTFKGRVKGIFQRIVSPFTRSSGHDNA